MEQQLKQRLVGAVVLVALAVIFIPVILEGPGNEWPPRNHSIPQPPPLDFQAGMELPLPESAAPPAAGPATAAAEPEAPPPPQLERAVTASEPPAAVAESAPAAQPATPAAAAAVTAAPPEPRAPAPATPADGWYAQVGSFSQQANADGLRARLVKAGYSARLQQTDTTKGSSYRVLVGPLQAREDAEKLLQKLVSEQRVKRGIVIELSGAG
ncbi:MAG: SPOR domain-containing protein [Pseudomonadota bacterium]